MLNLFLKDFYLIKKHLWIVAFYSFMLFFLLNAQGREILGVSYTVGTAMIGYTLIMYTTAYDDKNNSEVLLNSLPVSRRIIVLTRYLSLIFYAIIGFISMLVAGYILKALGFIHIKDPINFMEFISAFLSLSIITFLYLPTYFKFGYVTAKIFNMILFAVAFGGPLVINNLTKTSGEPIMFNKFMKFIESQPESIIGVYLLILILILGIISYGVSMFFYNQREF